MAGAAAEMRKYLNAFIGIVDAPGGNADACRDAIRDERLDTIQDLSEFDQMTSRPCALRSGNQAGQLLTPMIRINVSLILGGMSPPLQRKN